MEIKHKFDLDSESVQLDYDMLVSTAQSAVRYTLDTLHRHMLMYYDCISSKPVSPVYTNAMLEDATALAKATITLYYLCHGRDRDKGNMVNRRADESKRTN